MLLSTSVLWLATKYLIDRGSFHWIASLPATVGTAVSISYISTAGIGLNMPIEYSKPIGIAIAIICAAGLLYHHSRQAKATPAN